MLYKNSGLGLLRILRYYGGRIGARLLTKENQWQSVEELDPGITVVPIQPFYCEKNLSNILIDTVEPVRSRESVGKRLRSQKMELKPYVVHHLVDAVVFSDHVFCDQAHHVTDSSPSFHATRLLKLEELPEAALSHTYFASLYWGHWLSFELPTQFVLGERAPLISTRSTAKYKDEGQWRNLLDAREVSVAQGFLVDRLMIATGTSETITCVRTHKKIREILGGGRSGKRRRVFIVRPSGGNSRTILNQSELLSALELEGYEVVDPSKLTFEEFLSKCKDAEEIMSIEGSHLISTMYLVRRDGLVVVLQPPGWVGFNHSDACHFLGIATAVFIGNPSGADWTCFSVDIEELLRFLEQARTWAVSSQQKLIDYSGLICGSSD